MPSFCLFGIVHTWYTDMHICRQHIYKHNIKNLYFIYANIRTYLVNSYIYFFILSFNCLFVSDGVCLALCVYCLFLRGKVCYFADGLVLAV